ncbi:MAG: DUF4397 domain-containing protein [Hungatella sp.]|nr:DUF4397 domain-containing protein [Hungatella sp.]
MYIDKDGLSLTRSASDNAEGTQTTETTDASFGSSSPGFAPISPDTPSWGPPSGSGGSNDPGFFPISPDTPSWGPPSGSGGSNDPGFFPISPDTPSWGPPPGNNGGGNNNRPIIIVPGQNNCFNCSTGSSSNVRFLHAAVNQPAVNIMLGNRTVINNMQYGNFTPYYLSGSQNTLVTVTNTQTGQTLFRRYINLAGQTAYTMSIINNGSGISVFTLTDTPCSYRNAGCLRAVNLSPNSGAVDLFLSGYGRIFQRVGQYDATGYNTIRQGTYRTFVSEALPCSNNNGVILGDGYVECSNTRIAIMDSATINVMNGVTYTLYIIGLAYQFPSLQILPLESDLIY